MTKDAIFFNSRWKKRWLRGRTMGRRQKIVALFHEGRGEIFQILPFKNSASTEKEEALVIEVY